MKIEINIDCVDDTKRIPKGQTLTWIVIGDDMSRDARMRKLADIIVQALKEHYPITKEKVVSK